GFSGGGDYCCCAVVNIILSHWLWCEAISDCSGICTLWYRKELDLPSLHKKPGRPSGGVWVGSEKVILVLRVNGLEVNFDATYYRSHGIYGQCRQRKVVLCCVSHSIKSMSRWLKLVL